MTGKGTMVASAEGTVKTCDAGRLVLQPKGTTYELHLDTAAQFSPGQGVRGVISLKGRKVWTVGAGGGFITPITGTPRVIQGRIVALDGNSILVQAGALVSIELPDDRSSMDLKNGGLAPGVMVNVTTMPGAKFEPMTA